MEQELEEKFSRFGKLESVVVKKSYNNEYSFAFIEFKEGEDASNAVNEYSLLEVGSTTLLSLGKR
jgi:RNA recognition motif-containing protein